MYRTKRLFQLVFAVLTIMIVGCAPGEQNSPSHPAPSIPVSTPTPRFLSTQTATYDPNDIPPELLFTPTPDPNAFTISATIEPGSSEEEITRILFSEWLDHFTDESMSLEWRLSEYTIDSIFIPADQICAQKLKALFIAEAVVTAKTALPSHSTTGNSSDWMVSAGGYISESDTHRTIRFKSAISQLNDEYTLEVIMQVPMCE